MKHWLLDSLHDQRIEALRQANIAQINNDLIGTKVELDDQFIYRTAEILELVVQDLLSERKEIDTNMEIIKSCSADAFRLLRVVKKHDNPMANSGLLLRMCSLAVIGDMGADAARLLRERVWLYDFQDSNEWGLYTKSTIFDVWLLLIRKQGWKDRDLVLDRIAKLRQSQQNFEEKYLDVQEPHTAKGKALELVVLYHLAKVAEILATFMTEGVVEGNFRIQQLIDTHFDRVFEAIKYVPDNDLVPMSHLLEACARQMIDNSIWTVTRAVNSKVTQFVHSIVARGRGNNAIFDVLPPQRRALYEKGLLGSSRRAVVVSLPTSSGKTLIAQFRILQAINQFEADEGWIAYLVPTRTLVNQIVRRFRRDFMPLNIIVEQISPALEIDNIEMKLLMESDKNQKFRIIVTTPEKLDLMLRQGWEEKIGRPLTLVVVDEAHNIQNSTRGLKLELLLATINKECQYAQFLLLTPFISNGAEVAKWLGDKNSDDISFSVDWQPNDRAIGIVHLNRGDNISTKHFDYDLKFETIHTSRNTIFIDDLVDIGQEIDIAKHFAQAESVSVMAAITAQHLNHRGPIIIMHERPDWVWSLADKLKIEANKKNLSSKKVQLVVDFLRSEYGDQFPLIDLLTYQIGVHHAGLSDDIRALMEWLFEENELRFLVATTTIAQGVNFPVTGVVMATNRYSSPKPPYHELMPPEDFWNIAGRAGRVDQSSLGIVAMMAPKKQCAQNLRDYINRQAGELNSALVKMALDSKESLSNLERIVYEKPEWSSFLQYLVHTYQQIGKPRDFINQVEQVLRGTFGFEKLRETNPKVAQDLLVGIRSYTGYIERPSQPLKLVDSTGFSLQSINTVLTNKGGIDGTSWNTKTIFSEKDRTLQDMMGILLKVPELRENLQAVIGGHTPDGQKLALIIKDWVNGDSVSNIAQHYFNDKGSDLTRAMTHCGQQIYGKLSQTASWGVGALLSITGSELSEDQFKQLSNLPSMIYYGVNNETAIKLRLLGVPRTAAKPLGEQIAKDIDISLPQVREYLKNLSENVWEKALGSKEGRVYRSVWRILEGLER